MSNTETTLAATALAVALVAFITALGQLLGQYFATADGYRRCQKSVMGQYAQKTRLQWRWSEFRFETLYTTPELFLAGDGAPNRVGQVLLTGSEPSREKSFLQASSLHQDDMRTMSVQGRDDILIYQNAFDVEAPQGRRAEKLPKQNAPYRGDMVCWIPFLHWIHMKTSKSLDGKNQALDPEDFPPPRMRLPAVIFRERSWDFQPPDVVRPLAKTTLSDIAVMARRMGMKWKDFRPSEGILRAEGHSQTITSTMVRSVGLVLQYSYTGQSPRLILAEENLRKRLMSESLLHEQEEVYIPRAAADRLGCGVIRTEPKLGLPDLTVSSQHEIVTALSYLDSSGTTPSLLTKTIKENPDFRFRVADLVALTTAPARLRGSPLVQVPAPSDNVYGVTTSSVGRRAFRACLEEYVVMHQGDLGHHTMHGLQKCHEFGTQFAAWDHTDEYSIQDEQWIVTRDPRYLDILHEEVLRLTNVLHEWEQQHSFRYRNLLGIHIRAAMLVEGGETSMLRNWNTDYEADVDGYFRVLPTIVEEMEKTGFYDRQMIVDAWVMMMMRAMCWGACHFFVPGERVPIQYFGSQLPVYIG